MAPVERHHEDAAILKDLLGVPRPKRSYAFRLVRALFAGIAICYLLLTGAIWYAQMKILYHPNSLVDATPADSGVKFTEVMLPLRGDNLSGWWVPSEEPGARTLLFLHGNAGNVAVNVDQVLRLRSTGLNVFIIDYRIDRADPALLSKAPGLDWVHSLRLQSFALSPRPRYVWLFFGQRAVLRKTSSLDPGYSS